MSSSLENQSKAQKSLAEVVSNEKRLLPLMYSRGILHGEVLEVYHEVRTGLEKILLSTNEMAEIQDVEYLLWKLHYKHINEFRKRIRQQSLDKDNVKETHPQNVDSPSKSDHHLEGFKSFLSEASKFYNDLIFKLKRSCGLLGEVLLDNNASSFSVEPTKLHKHQFTCHRLLICLGDLSRYAEILKKPDARRWSVAANYYLRATKTWPGSGNPHNQLALLATYVGDSFLALYHSMRSLEVKEPFPDAWGNLLLLFEEIKPTQLPTFSSEVFDFYNVPRRNFLHNISTAENGSPKESKIVETNHASAEKFDLWSAVIRTISFFIIRSSLEEFPHTFAHTLSSLEALLVVNDAELTATMESYQFLDTLRKGPYRAIQLVSTFIFVLHRLVQNPKLKDPTGIDENMQSEYTTLALATVFICMGRLTERCWKCNMAKCPLLPAVLVFVEWLVGALDDAEPHVADERVVNAMSYFFGVLSEFLNRLDQNESIVDTDNTALWEDHELRGFYPLAHVHEMLDFTTTNQEWEGDSYRRRSQRIIHAATRIVDRAKTSRDWISKDKEGRNFCSFEKEKCPSQAESSGTGSGSSLEVMINAETWSTLKKTRLMIAEDEEVILFNPITRHNSAPIYTPQSKTHPVSPEATDTQRTLLDECLCRATTFSTSQQSEDGDSFSFCSTVSDSGQHKLFKDLTTHSTGPPSLSAWVLNRGVSKYETENGTKDFNEHKKLDPIEEIASMSLSDLSILEKKNFDIDHRPITTISYNSPPYVAPLPSAPLLPENTVWLKMNPLISPEYKNGSDGILGAAPYTKGVSNRSPIGSTPPRVSVLVDGYPPVLGMSSSEWLYHYRNSQNVENTSNHISPLVYNARPAFENFQTNQVCRLDLRDQWGNHLVPNPMVYLGSPQLHPNTSPVYGSADQKQPRETFFTGYQRPVPYLCGVGMEIRQEQRPLLQYLKERECLLQSELQLRGHTFVGN
ncbi:nonsense-mediated mRNA decay factor SMG7-like [Primulina huaijiensis]|uniref:nonsense-mediated mRNA decay factor SMG7-like n=1 Tax=Primulina huaijiensis TaxID=1492673 RepID=UPI003CC76F3B